MRMMSFSMADLCKTTGQSTEWKMMNRQGYLRNKVQASFSLLFLQLQRNSTNRSTLNSLHQMGNKTSNFISHSLWWDDSDFTNKSLVNMEIKSQTRIIFLNDNSWWFLDSFCSDTLQPNIEMSQIMDQKIEEREQDNQGEHDVIIYREGIGIEEEGRGVPF